jgi:hypothetical protein
LEFLDIIVINVYKFALNNFHLQDPSRLQLLLNRMRCQSSERLFYQANSSRVCKNISLQNTCNISNQTMRTGLDFKSAQFDHVRGEAEDWIKMRGLEI